MPSAVVAMAQRRRKKKNASASPSPSAIAAGPQMRCVSWWRIGPSTTCWMTSGTRTWASIAPRAVTIMNHIANR